MALPDVRTPGWSRARPLREAPPWKKNNNNNNNNFLLAVGKNQESLSRFRCLPRDGSERPSQSWAFAKTSDFFKVKLAATFYCRICWKEPRPGERQRGVKKLQLNLILNQKKPNCPVPTLELEHGWCLVCSVVRGAGCASILTHDVWAQNFPRLTFQKQFWHFPGPEVHSERCDSGIPTLCRCRREFPSLARAVEPDWVTV